MVSVQFARSCKPRITVAFAVGHFSTLDKVLRFTNTQTDTRGFDVTGVVTEIDLTFPAIKNECDCIQACLDRVNICANYVWKFSTPASVRSGHRTCTLYSTFNIPPSVTIDYNTTSPLNKNIIAALIDNPQVGGQVPRAYKDVHLNSIPDNDAVSG